MDSANRTLSDSSSKLGSNLEGAVADPVRYQLGVQAQSAADFLRGGVATNVNWATSALESGMVSLQSIRSDLINMQSSVATANIVRNPGDLQNLNSGLQTTIKGINTKILNANFGGVQLLDGTLANNNGVPASANLPANSSPTNIMTGATSTQTLSLPRLASGSGGTQDVAVPGAFQPLFPIQATDIAIAQQATAALLLVNNAAIGNTATIASIAAETQTAVDALAVPVQNPAASAILEAAKAASRAYSIKATNFCNLLRNAINGGNDDAAGALASILAVNDNGDLDLIAIKNAYIGSTTAANANSPDGAVVGNGNANGGGLATLVEAKTIPVVKQYLMTKALQAGLNASTNYLNNEAVSALTNLNIDATNPAVGVPQNNRAGYTVYVTTLRDAAPIGSVARGVYEAARVASAAAADPQWAGLYAGATAAFAALVAAVAPGNVALVGASNPGLTVLSAGGRTPAQNQASAAATITAAIATLDSVIAQVANASASFNEIVETNNAQIAIGNDIAGDYLKIRFMEQMSTAKDALNNLKANAAVVSMNNETARLLLDTLNS